MVNFSSLVIAVALLVNLVDHSATFASPANRMKDDTANQNSISAVMDDDAMNVAGPSGFSPRRFPLIEGRLADEDGIKKIFILSDLGSKGASGSDASSGFGRAFPVLSPWRIDRALAATQKDEWHDADDLIPMAKRNTDNKKPEAVQPSKCGFSLSLIKITIAKPMHEFSQNARWFRVVYST
ncbi:pro-MCH precursor [Silurus asotus]|uniref:Pro-MCH n=1 Tax=Silurus asotus TaxID=30991 RepID=A0AAD5AK08_SILAS|nr:pro-MCH precursor [Silurus asotus]